MYEEVTYKNGDIYRGLLLKKKAIGLGIFIQK